MKKILVAYLMALLLPLAVAHPASAANRGNCEQYVPLFVKYHLPVNTFKNLAWRESGCNHKSFIIDSDDAGGGLLGINLKGRLAASWKKLCGATLANITNAEVNVRCAGKVYSTMGLRPWVLHR